MFKQQIDSNPNKGIRMNFETFKNNVEQWALERGIYAYSTPEAQLLKAFEELGELARHLGKGDLEATKDDLGDVAVCLVNYAYMEGVDIDLSIYTPATMDLDFFDAVTALMATRTSLHSGKKNHLSFSLRCLRALAESQGHTFEACCEHAWNEIKDRRGKMVEGGFFVKEGEMMKKRRTLNERPNRASDGSILLEAHKIVNGDRKADYGDSNRNLKNIALQAGILGVEIDAIGVAKVLLSVKMAREGYKHKRDNLVDLAGYAELLNRLYEELEGEE